MTTADPMPRPVQPTLRRQLAQFISMLDPRCDNDAHNTIAEGKTCPVCGRSLFDYNRMVPDAWTA